MSVYIYNNPHGILGRAHKFGSKKDNSTYLSSFVGHGVFEFENYLQQKAKSGINRILLFKIHLSGHMAQDHLGQIFLAQFQNEINVDFPTLILQQLFI